ncbi:hybrid sensor histidine kinase/response regulator [Tautonia marina]|uniref:hybrid sensor histidine kinase/response regulator n=1 Tax=Tautonia marina TaxID=2653855 RepID=UPI001260626F|nr:hybrid sensor histidine kinase/response regulator [Tautonia marina]
MTPSTHAIRDRNHADLGAILRRDAEAILDTWAERAIAQGHGRPGAHREELRDHLPEFLIALGDDLTGDDDSPRHEAIEHGRFRWKDGWELQDVVIDYQLLRIVILERLQQQLGHNPSFEQVVAIGVHIDDAIAQAVVAYVEHQAVQLQQAHQRLNEFLGVLGHELRNPLGTIAVGLQLAKLCAPPQGDLSDAVDGISRGVLTMTRLMDDMLDVARVTRGDLEIRRSFVSLTEVITSAVSSTRSLVDESRHRLALSLPPDPMTVEADPTRLEQILVNLITNAVKYSEPGALIEVIADREQDQAVIQVRDNGAGIAPDFLPHLFDLFAQAPEHNGRGLGIGLALVRNLVERHGGTISAQSDGIGQGSTFTIRLPLVRQASETPGSPASEPTAAGGAALPSSPRRILIVDDERDAARLLALLLEQDGHEVRVAFDGASALTEAESMRPDLVLLDLGLPDFDGRDVAQRLIASAGAARPLIVALTGFSPGQRSGETPPEQDTRFDLFLTKPVEAESLERVLALRHREDAPPSDPV